MILLKEDTILDNEAASKRFDELDPKFKGNIAYQVFGDRKGKGVAIKGSDNSELILKLKDADNKNLKHALDKFQLPLVNSIAAKGFDTKNNPFLRWVIENDNSSKINDIRTANILSNILLDYNRYKVKPEDDWLKEDRLYEYDDPTYLIQLRTFLNQQSKRAFKNFKIDSLFNDEGKYKPKDKISEIINDFGDKNGYNGDNYLTFGEVLDKENVKTDVKRWLKNKLQAAPDVSNEELAALADVLDDRFRNQQFRKELGAAGNVNPDLSNLSGELAKYLKKFLKASSNKGNATSVDPSVDKLYKDIVDGSLRDMEKEDFINLYNKYSGQLNGDALIGKILADYLNVNKSK